MGGAVKKRRLDLLLVERGLAESRSRAQWLIREGRVRVGERVASRPSEAIPKDVSLRVDETLPYVSRGGLKLAHALDTFAVAVAGLTALDVGASTGGFTDCLLQRGAQKVYAVDVGHDQLHPRLRSDPRVTSLEGNDIRELEHLPGGAPADFAVVDVSFISLRLVLPAVLSLLHPGGEIIALIKPQFEAGPQAVSRRGIVRDEGDRQRAVQEVVDFARDLGLEVVGVCPTPPSTPRGNIEYLAYLRREKR